MAVLKFKDPDTGLPRSLSFIPNLSQYATQLWVSENFVPLGLTEITSQVITLPDTITSSTEYTLIADNAHNLLVDSTVVSSETIDPGKIYLPLTVFEDNISFVISVSDSEGRQPVWIGTEGTYDAEDELYPVGSSVVAFFNYNDGIDSEWIISDFDRTIDYNPKNLFVDYIPINGLFPVDGSYMVDIDTRYTIDDIGKTIFSYNEPLEQYKEWIGVYKIHTFIEAKNMIVAERILYGVDLLRVVVDGICPFLSQYDGIDINSLWFITERSISISDATLLVDSWELVGGYWEYNYENDFISENSIVDFIPNDGYESIIEEAMPSQATLSSNGSVRFRATNEPTGDIIGTINIHY